MKKIISLLVCAVLILSLCACVNNKTASDYDDVIAKLGETVNGLFAEGAEDKIKEGEYPSPTGEHDDKWMTTLLDAKKDFNNVDENAFGYKIIDINSDSIAELLFMRSDDRILAIFTMCEGKVTMVDCYNRSYRAVIRDTGEVYTMTVRDDGGYDYRIYTLNHSSATLFNTVAFGYEGSIAYESVNGEIYTTTTERITELTTQYPYEMAVALSEMQLNLF